MKLSTPLLALVAVVLSFDGAHGQYRVPRDVVAAGGGSSSGPSFRLSDTVSQTAVFIVNSKFHINERGFWYQIGYVATAIDDDILGLPRQYRLDQNYPNPFNPTTTIRFALPDPSYVELTLYDVAGHKVRVLVNDDLPPGEHRIIVDARQLATGVYFYRITTSRFTQTRKLVVIK